MNESERIWIFPLQSEIPASAVGVLQDSLAEFVRSWKAHGTPVHGKAQIVHRRFIVLSADAARSEVSGCSIDSMFRAVQGAAKGAGAELAPLDRIFYRSGDEIRCVTRDEFRELAKKGVISGETGARASWHGRLIPAE